VATVFQTALMWVLQIRRFVVSRGEALSRLFSGMVKAV
jgi:hypothetical protein